MRASFADSISAWKNQIPTFSTYSITRQLRH